MKTTNKKVIRINKKQDGTYLIVSKYILHNTNLKDFDKILLMSILSDADDFNFNVATYANRFGCERDKISRAIKRLVHAGYMKQEEKENRFNKWEYIISEYGNLNIEDKEPVREQPTQPVEPIAEQPAKQAITSPDREKIINKIFDKVDAVQNSGTMVDADALTQHVKTALDAGTLTLAVLTDEVLDKLILKYKVKKLTVQDADKMVDMKSNGLSIKDTASLKLRTKEWLKNNPFATEAQLSNEILKGKNTFRKPHVGYND